MKHESLSLGAGAAARGAFAALVFLAMALLGCAAGPETSENVGSEGEELVIGGLFSTGVDAAGAPLANGSVDPHYVLSSNDLLLPGPNAIVVNPAGGWTGNTATSKWISGRANTQGIAGGTYTYTATVTLAGVNPASATLTGRWACDDSCTLVLNGTVVATNPTPAWGAVANFNVPAGSPFVIGVNTLAFVATNTTGGPTGLEVVSMTGAVNGCNADNQCTAAQFCNNVTATCVPKVANGNPVPTVAGHAPPLTGVCTAAAGTAACASGVCDAADNDCGFANGDGPCTLANGPTVCRSGACSVNGTCEPTGGCNVDADCNGGAWCDIAAHACLAKLGNGTPMPTDPGHAAPVLDGTCNAAAATLVCASGVCDAADNLCGFANGDGPCNAGNGNTVCRSGACSVNGTCEPAGGCNVDADCGAGNWCDETNHVCTNQVPNGGAMPGDPAHTPPLDGTCNPAAAAIVCVSGVCDVDNLCGLADGDGPCSGPTGPVVCRSGVCSANGTCEPVGGCNVDVDCAATQFCNTPTHLCTAQLPNGTPVPTVPGHNPTLDGTCTGAAGTVACLSGVCDTKDNACGFANGDGPCVGGSGAAVCRSTLCGTSGANAGTCVACLATTDCAGTSTCNPTTNTCVGCATNADCTSPTGVCDVTTGTCVACTKDADCGNATSGEVCDDTTKTCEAGCRGTGNGCPSGEQCSSKDDTIGTCGPTTTTSSSSSSGTGGASSSSSGQGGHTGASGSATGTSAGGGLAQGATGAGGGGPNNENVVALGGGCACDLGERGEEPPFGAAALLALGAAIGWRRKRAAARGQAISCQLSAECACLKLTADG